MSKTKKNGERYGDVRDAIPPELLETFLDRLLEARAEFAVGKDGGRSGVIKALTVATLFLSFLDPQNERGLVDPLVVLDNALRALDRNNVQALLKPKRKSSRSIASDSRIIAQALSVYAAETLMETGMGPLEAYKRIAKALKDIGVRSSGFRAPISERTIRGWKERASKEFAKGSPLANHLADYRKKNPFGGLSEIPAVARAKVILMIFAMTLKRFRTAEAK